MVILPQALSQQCPHARPPSAAGRLWLWSWSWLSPRSDGVEALLPFHESMQSRGVHYAAHSPTSSRAFVTIAEDAAAMNDFETTIRVIEVVYQAFDEGLDASSVGMAA